MRAPHDPDAVRDAAGVSLRPREFARMGVLRYFDRAGPFVASAARAAGGALPAPRQAVHYRLIENGPEIILACLNPTATLVLCSDAQQFEALGRQVAGRLDGCLVEQTGGLWVCAVSGGRAPELLARLGARSAIAAPGEARTGRLADLAVTSVCVQPGETLLVVERVYRDHLAAWIEDTLGDFERSARPPGVPPTASGGPD
jgi:hypothetical protein